MSDPLTPTLTGLDERVLGALLEHKWMRARDVAAYVHRRDEQAAYGTPERRRARQAALTEEVRSILRGLEHLGYVESRPGGWWRRA